MSALRGWKAPILIAVGLVLGVLSLTGAFTDSGGYVLSAEFTDAEGLQPNFFVKINGVTVGRVASVTVSRQDTAIVTMDIDASALPIGRNVTATIRPNSFFGEHYVDLDPGDTEHPAPSGMRIPLSRTSEATELDQLLDVLDPQTRLALGIFLNESGIALLGRGHDLASTLQLLPHTLSDAQELIGALGADNRALGQLIDRSSLIVEAISAQRPALGRLVSGADAALAATAARSGDLTQTIRAAPGVVTQLRTTLGDLDRTATALTPAAHGLASTAGPLAGLLQAMPAFTAAAVPTLTQAARVAPLLTELGREGTPVVAGLRAPTTQLVALVRPLAPVLTGLEQSIDDILGFLEGYARAMQDGDAAGHIYRPAQTYANLGEVISLFESATAARSPGRTRHPIATRPRPGTPGRPAAPVTLPRPALPKLPGSGTVTLPILPKLPTVGAPTAGATLGHLLSYLLAK